MWTTTFFNTPLFSELANFIWKTKVQSKVKVIAWEGKQKCADPKKQTKCVLHCR